MAATAERPHGYARYKIEGCRCYVCGWAVASYSDAREHAIRRGTWQPYVDATPARQHAEQLKLAGVGDRTIARLAGLDRKRVRELLHGRPERGTPPLRRIRPETAQAILAVDITLDVLPNHLPIDATGSVRRLQALVRRGWPQAQLADRLGMNPANFGVLLGQTRLTAAKARAVADLYRRLENTDPLDHGVALGPRNRAVNHATRNGWPLPAMWDDDAIDDPAAFPDWTGECGTPKGFRLHRSRRVLPVCDPCRQAVAAERAGTAVAA